MEDLVDLVRGLILFLLSCKLIEAALSNRNTVQATYVILNFLVVNLKKGKMRQVKLILMKYLTQYTQNIMQICNQHKNY